MTGFSAKGTLIGIAVTLVLAAAALGTVACAPEDDVVAVEHPEIASDQSCDSCKDAPEHTYRHSVPYSGDCETCHTTSSWSIIHFDHEDDIFDTSFHGVVGCSRCHTEGQPVPDESKCQNCHSGKSPHGPEVQDCETCHTAVAWALNSPVPEGHLTLLGGHAGLSCFMCHTGARIPARDRRCVDCHGTNHGGLTDCEDCHDPVREWRPVDSFDHGAFFVLEGAHANADCARCHSDGKFVGTPTTCVGCHGTKHGGLTNCQDCHTPVNGDWTPKAGFDHGAFFPLIGRHALAQCASCHANGRFAGTPTACVSCHGDHHRGLTSCQNCHSPLRSWQPVNFNHDSYFKLTGKHTSVACTKCHVNGKFDGTPTVCVSCHGARHGGLTACSACHTTAGFVPSTFNHSTKFKLVGAHTSLACSKCHPFNLYANVIGTGTACADCHGLRHGAAYPTCTNCHTTSAWIPVKDTVTHPAPIELGAEHASRSCTLCHTTLIFSAPTKPCVDCHSGDIPHVGPTDCVQCHMPTLWQDFQFVHIAIPDHVYEGPDPQYADCTLCHTDGDFTSYTCDRCHAPGTVTPDGPVTTEIPIISTVTFRSTHPSR